MKPDRYKLWNPWAVAGWSLLFSSASGAWLHAANWLALGRPDKAAAARRWGWLVIAALLLSGMAAALFEQYACHLPVITVMTSMAAWCGFPARDQCRYVRDRYGGDYRRRAWWPPLLAGIVGWIVLALVSLLMATLLIGAGGFYI